MKNLLLKLKNELTFSKDMKKLFLQSLFLGLFIFLSIWWKGFSICALIVAITFILINRNVKSVYLILFLLPFMSIFKFNTSGSYLLTYVVIAFIAVLGVKLFIEFIKKQKKINIPLTIILGLFEMFLLLQIKLSNLSIFFSLSLGLLLLYVLHYYKDNLDFKEATYSFGLGVLLSVLIGLFILVSPRLKHMITIYYELGKIRFSACAENVNVFSGELMIMLAAFTCLYLKKDIDKLYPIVYTFSFLVLIFTASKSALIIFIAITLFLLCNSAVTKKKKCYWDIILVVVAVGLTFIITQDRFIICFKRLFNIKIEESVTNIASQITTGRLDIWLQYLDVICSSVKTFLFGLGISAGTIGEFNGYTGASTHNTFIQCFYHTGLIGSVLFVCFLSSYIGWKKVFKLKAWNVLIIMAVAMFLFGLDFFSYRFSNYFILIMLSYPLGNKKDKTNKEVKVENSSDCNPNVQQGELNN